MTGKLDYNAGKRLPDDVKAWNALQGIYTWRVYFMDGELDWHDHLGTREQAIQVVTRNGYGDNIISVQRWHSDMIEHEIED